MNKTDIVEIINKLGLVDNDITVSDIESIVDVVALVNEMVIYNDQATIKDFIIALIGKAIEEDKKPRSNMTISPAYVLDGYDTREVKVEHKRLLEDMTKELKETIDYKFNLEE